MRKIFHLALYPFAAPLLPVLHFYLGNFRVLNIGDGVRITLVFLGLSGILLIGARSFWAGSQRAAVVVTPLLLVVFKGSHLGATASVALLAASLGLGVLLRRKRLDCRRLCLPLNMAALVLVLLPVARIVTAELREDSPVPSPLFHTPIVLNPAPSGPPPDIYYLLVDGLGQPEYLAHNYAVPARDLREVLASRGFQVLERSRCSYPQTALSVASTLNLATLPEILKLPDATSKERRVLREIIGKNRVTRALRELGYHVATFPSGYPVTRFERPDRRHEPIINPTFLEYYVLDDGILPLLQGWLGRGPSDLSYAMRRRRLNAIFTGLPRARDGLPATKPVFVFAHILAPHPPFVFDAAGGTRNPPVKFGFADGSHWHGAQAFGPAAYKALYAEQFSYVMRRLGAAIDAILAQAPRPPVIIVQGDHGPGAGLNWEAPDQTDHAERFGIFNAFYFPPGSQITIADDESALNTFALVFNEIFAAGLELKPRRSWFARSSQPYLFLEVLE